jgi:hypothetical protein
MIKQYSSIGAMAVAHNVPMLNEGGAINHYTQYEDMNLNLAHTYPRSTSPPLSFKHVLAAAASSNLAPMHTVVIKFFERGKFNHS